MTKKIIFVMCKKCGTRIQIKLDRNIKFPDGSDLYWIVHAHGDLEKDAHALIIEIDRNLNVRNTRVSDEFFFTYDI
ncbi:MAG: hypothetical protein JW776_02540 [Candidatus Lokiarchaeota archaeon]|nr:hypothetical protein [Candidatus Lokiarchaeota archaeon]